MTVEVRDGRQGVFCVCFGRRCNGGGDRCVEMRRWCMKGDCSRLHGHLVEFVWAPVQVRAGLVRAAKQSIAKQLESTVERARRTGGFQAASEKLGWLDLLAPGAGGGQKWCGRASRCTQLTARALDWIHRDRPGDKSPPPLLTSRRKPKTRGLLAAFIPDLNTLIQNRPRCRQACCVCTTQTHLVPAHHAGLRRIATGVMGLAHYEAI